MRRRCHRSREERHEQAGRNAGLEAALEHIEEARQLSVTLGGTDKDVKDYFFHLSPDELSSVLNAYERAFGREKRKYAEETMPSWKRGTRKMSGLVAGRLFSLLPPLMPLDRKFLLVRSLWENKCPHSRQSFYIGPDASDHDVCEKVRSHLLEVVQDYTIPDEIVNRFRWLALNDVNLQQELYNYFLELNREVVADASEQRVPVLLKQLRRGDGVSQRLTQSIKVGNHHLELIFDSKAVGVSVMAPRQPVASSQGCLVILVAVVFLAILLPAWSACHF